MINPVLSGGWAFSNSRRSLGQIVPSSWMNLWDSWEIRGVVLFSLLVQIVLTVMGSRRKYMSMHKTSSDLARFIIWAFYLSADWAATFAIGLLACSSRDTPNGGSSADPRNVIKAFWAPFLLLHLGGPETITAFSLEDNSLWIRHLAGLLAQFVTTLYVFLKYLNGTDQLYYAGIPIFISGLIKCVERILALRHASKIDFTEALDHSSAFVAAGKRERIKLHGTSAVPVSPTTEEEESSTSRSYTVADPEGLVDPVSPRNEEETGGASDIPFLQQHGPTLNRFKWICSRYSLVHYSHLAGYPEFRHGSDAFEVIEAELGLVYDFLHTKASLTYSLKGFVLKVISFCLAILAFGLFLAVRKDHDHHLTTEMTVTWFLLIGGILLEIYTVVVLLSSNSFMLWLVGLSGEGQLRRSFKDFSIKYISEMTRSLQRIHVIPASKTWSGTMGQYSLISFCCDMKTTRFSCIQDLFGIYEVLKTKRFVRLIDVPRELKLWIFEGIQEMKGARHEFRDLRVDVVLKKHECFKFFKEWSEYIQLEHLDIDKCILIWHIATDLCRSRQDIALVGRINIRCSMWLSDYMLYLLVMNPSMLPKGLGERRYQDTLDYLNYNIGSPYLYSSGQVHSDLYEGKIPKIRRSASGREHYNVFWEARELARALESLEKKTGWNSEKKWKVISDVWLEMMVYAAARCSGRNHAQQLANGGELLTHVWFLMAHLGFLHNHRS